MSNPYAMSPGVQSFLGKEGAGLIDYSEFGLQAVKDASENERAEILANALQDIAKYKGEALQDITKYRTEAELALKGPQKQSGLDRALGMVQSGLSIAGGLKGMGAFDGFGGGTEALGLNAMSGSGEGQASITPGIDKWKPTIPALDPYAGIG